MHLEQVELIGGRLTVSSKEHCGSTFTFILPYKVSTSCDNFDDLDELSDVDGNEDDTIEGFFQNQKGLVQLRMHLQLLLMLLRCMNQQVHQTITLKRRMKVHFNRNRTTYNNCSGVPKKCPLWPRSYVSRGRKSALWLWLTPEAKSHTFWPHLNMPQF